MIPCTFFGSDMIQCCLPSVRFFTTRIVEPRIMVCRCEKHRDVNADYMIEISYGDAIMLEVMES